MPGAALSASQERCSCVSPRKPGTEPCHSMWQTAKAKTNQLCDKREPNTQTTTILAFAERDRQGKIRPMDDYRASMVNASVTQTESKVKLDLGASQTQLPLLSNTDERISELVNEFEAILSSASVLCPTALLRLRAMWSEVSDLSQTTQV